MRRLLLSRTEVAFRELFHQSSFLFIGLFLQALTAFGRLEHRALLLGSKDDLVIGRIDVFILMGHSPLCIDEGTEMACLRSPAYDLLRLSTTLGCEIGHAGEVFGLEHKIAATILLGFDRAHSSLKVPLFESILICVSHFVHIHHFSYLSLYLLSIHIWNGSKVLYIYCINILH